MNDRFATMRVPLSEEDSRVATQLVRGHQRVEVSGRAGELDPSPELLNLPEPRPMEDYIAATCKHEYIIITQMRHAKHACMVLKAHNPVRRALMRAIACQCN